MQLAQIIDQLSAPSDRYRKALLDAIAVTLAADLKRGEAVDLLFVCTHNSRRSQLAQVWVQTWAAHYDLNGLACYSGGTEVTRVHPAVLQSLATQGFVTTQHGNGDQPTWQIARTDAALNCTLFSKRYDDASIPRTGLTVVTTCSDADRTCPYVPGSKERYGLTYEDPKHADGTPQEAATYAAKSLEIASEWHYIITQIAKSI